MNLWIILSAVLAFEGCMSKSTGIVGRWASDSTADNKVYEFRADGSFVMRAFGVPSWERREGAWHLEGDSLSWTWRTDFEHETEVRVLKLTRNRLKLATAYGEFWLTRVSNETYSLLLLDNANNTVKELEAGMHRLLAERDSLRGELALRDSERGKSSASRIPN